MDPQSTQKSKGKKKGKEKSPPQKSVPILITSPQSSPTLFTQSSPGQYHSQEEEEREGENLFLYSRPRSSPTPSEGTTQLNQQRPPDHPLSVQETLIEVREIGANITRLVRQYLANGHITEEGLVALRNQSNMLIAQLEGMENMIKRTGEDALLTHTIPEMARARRFRKPKQSSKNKGGTNPTEEPLIQEEELSKKRKNDVRTCSACGTTSSPEWRRGPQGSNTFCNACGLHYAKLLKKQNTDSPPTISSEAGIPLSSPNPATPSSDSSSLETTPRGQPKLTLSSESLSQRLFPTTYSTYSQQQHSTHPTLTHTTSSTSREERRQREISLAPETYTNTTLPTPFYLHHQYNTYPQQTQQTFSPNIPIIQIQHPPPPQTRIQTQPAQSTQTQQPTKKKGSMALDSLLNP